jgi:hypothetical protein
MQRSSREHREKCGTPWYSGYLAEHANIDAIAADVAITQERHETTTVQRTR